MWIGKGKYTENIVLNRKTIPYKKHIKTLGIIIQNDLTWTMQAEAAIKKGAKLLSNFKFLRKYLTESQFLKAVSAHFYGTIFYACSVWYDCIKVSLKNKLRSLHYRLLRIACRDYYYEHSRDYLAKRCQRANPDEWAFYCSANVVMKILRDKFPSRLHSLLRSSYFEEPRKGGLGKFFDRSKTRVGRQSIQNRLDHLRQINRPWNGENLSNDLIRILLKDTFFNYRRNQS